MYPTPGFTATAAARGAGFTVKPGLVLTPPRARSTFYILTRRLCLGAWINNSGAGIYHQKKPFDRCTST